MTIAAGWYHAQGDPPGTVRRWNGETWIGFPVQPERPDGSHGAKAIAGAKPFTPVAGQVGLEGAGAVASVGLFTVMVAYAYLAYTLFLSIWQQPTSVFDTGPDVMTAVTYTAVAVAFAALCFTAWFTVAYRNLSLWHKTELSIAWAPFASLVLVHRLRGMMLELVERSARPDRQGEINPIVVLGWYGCWIFNQMFFFAAIGLNRYRIGGSSEQLALIGTIIGLVGLGCAIYLVQKISAAQETRRRPVRVAGSAVTA